MDDDSDAAALTPSVKAAIRLFYRGRCQYCGTSGAAHVEHIIARAKGGADTLANATLGCEPCNQRKRDLDLDPMFLAIAHARAREAAPRILALSRKGRAPAAARLVRPIALPPPPALHYEGIAPWGRLKGRSDSRIVGGYMHTASSGHLRDSRKLFSVRRPPGACRDLRIEFEADPDQGEVRVMRVQWWASFGSETGEATEHECEVAARYVSLCRQAILREAALLLETAARRMRPAYAQRCAGHQARRGTRDAHG